MIRSSLFISTTLLLVGLLGLMHRFSFLAPWRKELVAHCGGTVLIYTAILGLNLFAATLAINRKLFLKDTGRKLSHLDNHLQAESPENLPPFFEARR